MGLCSLQFDDFGLEDKDTLKVVGLLNTVMIITSADPLELAIIFIQVPGPETLAFDTETMR